MLNSETSNLAGVKMYIRKPNLTLKLLGIKPARGNRGFMTAWVDEQMNDLTKVLFGSWTILHFGKRSATFWRLYATSLLIHSFFNSTKQED